ncbi:hypothetical protein [Kingella oralis]|uniref:hypothetical protein n=1 Tax=Kingella oralis TaxID=505 RepID=UPI0028E9A41C|nr:hypothetical protein [Kingella oralis]
MPDAFPFVSNPCRPSMPAPPAAPIPTKGSLKSHIPTKIHPFHFQPAPNLIQSAYSRLPIPRK